MECKLLIGDALKGLSTLETGSVNCIVTSPPYYGLRDYGVECQLGQESSPEVFIQALVEVFREAKRVLRDDGTLWVNMGDSYNAGRNGGHAGGKKQASLSRHNGITKSGANVDGLKPKDLIGIPWTLAFALRADGWYLRQDIIWSKPNPMPESVTDRCTKSHEYIFLLSKSPKYYFDQIRIPLKDESIARLAQDIENQVGSTRVPGKTNGTMKAVRKNNSATPNMASSGAINHDGKSGYFDSEGNLLVSSTANKKSVWTVTTKPFSEAHFATFPPELIVDCIKAGCPEGGVVLDPFAGAGTTMMVANKLGRNSVGIELNREYAVGICVPRLERECGMFLNLEVKEVIN